MSDYGSATVTIPYSDLTKNEPLIFTRNIIVRENSGRYSGNTAEVAFTLILKPIE